MWWMDSALQRGCLRCSVPTEAG
uniref:Uncharacterized protein n=1 Tax=Arundo donax TaxID=35708 RepID=A0A0A9C017_ARUDO